MSEKQIARYQHVSNFAGLAMLIFGAIAAFDWLGRIKPIEGVSLTQIFTGLSVLCGVVTRWATQQLPAKKPNPPAATIVLLIAAGLMASAGCTNLAPGYRAVTVTVKVGNETGKTIASVCVVKRKECIDKHKESVPALQACLHPCHKALTTWTTIVRPAVNSSTSATLAGLETARQAKRPDSTWIAKLRPGVCALVGILKEWRPLMGDKAKSLLDLLATVEAVACSR